ncbi:MAG TPA: NAD(P)-dependent alcohol dehydrogenase, partial [Bryobacteraceae bacterium]|nr:NAD(P)-dependent alcohol dehydrogenase [Bryobacteraceae bacterium]
MQGVAAEYVLFDEEGLVRLPDYLSFEEAACLPCAGVTAWNALVSSGHLGRGDIVLTQGTGGVSIFALQIARLMQAEVIATSSSDDKLERVSSMGARAVINYKATPEWDKAALQATGGRGVDHIIEVGGASTMPLSLKAVRMGGRISVIGVLGGRDAVPFVPILMRSLKIQGIYVGSREMFQQLLTSFEQHQVRPVVDRVFGFGELPAALRYMQAGSHFGKIVLGV